MILIALFIFSLQGSLQHIQVTEQSQPASTMVLQAVPVNIQPTASGYQLQG